MAGISVYRALPSRLLLGIFELYRDDHDGTHTGATPRTSKDVESKVAQMDFRSRVGDSDFFIDPCALGFVGATGPFSCKYVSNRFTAINAVTPGTTDRAVSSSPFGFEAVAWGRGRFNLPQVWVLRGGLVHQKSNSFDRSTKVQRLFFSSVQISTKL